MAMFRRLHALGPKSGSDQAAQLLRSLSSRGNASSPHEQGSRVNSPTKSRESRDKGFGAIGPAINRRVFNSPNRGLYGLSGPSDWTGSIAVRNGTTTGVVMRALSGGADPSPHR